MASDDDMPALGDTNVDKAVSIIRGTVGVIPLIGPMLTELITNVIPNQRAERLEEYVLQLSTKVEELDQKSVGDNLKDPASIDIFEEGAFQSIRALSPERREQIAAVVAHGISGEEKERLEAKRILSLLRQIDDDQIITLTSYLNRNAHDDSFHNKHSTVLDPVWAHLGSDRNELDRQVMSRLARTGLVTLGLLRLRFKVPKKNEPPEFDKDTGQLKGSGHELTPLGRLLLSRIGVAEPGEF